MSGDPEVVRLRLCWLEAWQHALGREDEFGYIVRQSLLALASGMPELADLALARGQADAAP